MDFISEDKKKELLNYFDILSDEGKKIYIRGLNNLNIHVDEIINELKSCITDISLFSDKFPWLRSSPLFIRSEVDDFQANIIDKIKNKKIYFEGLAIEIRKEIFRFQFEEIGE